MKRSRTRLYLCFGLVLILLIAITQSSKAAYASIPLNVDMYFQQAELTPANSATSGNFGSAVALSADGNTALIGIMAANSNTGAAVVQIRTGTTWTQQAVLTRSSGATGDLFGRSVTLSADGNTALVGAEGVSSGTGEVIVFTRSGTIWTQQAVLTRSGGSTGNYFGRSVAVSSNGNVALVGASGVNQGSGRVVPFTRSGTTWTQQAEFTYSQTSPAYGVGYAVAISGDGNVALAGMPGAGILITGGAVLFNYNGSTWVEERALTIVTAGRFASVGSTVALNNNGTVALIGGTGPSTAAGFVSIFTNNSGIWTETSLLHANMVAAEKYGNSVSLDGSGNTALIGAPGISSNTGAAFVFTKSSGVWTEQQKLTRNGGATSDSYGYAVALSSDASTALIGASGVNSNAGAAIVYKFVTPPTSTPTFTPTITNTPYPIHADTIGVYNNGSWSLRNTNNAGGADLTALFGGDASDLPITGDWNGDDVDGIGVYRQNVGTFYLTNGNSGLPATNYTVTFGNPGDTPLAGKWAVGATSDGIGVYRPTNGILYQKDALVTGVSDYFAIFGSPGDQGITGDWNADGNDSVGVYRSSGGHWYMTNNPRPGGITFSDLDFDYTIGGNYPVVGDWNGDSTTTVGYYTLTGNFVLHSTNATAGTDNVFPFGAAGTRPVAGRWVVGSSPAGISVVRPVIPGGNNGIPDSAD